MEETKTFVINGFKIDITSITLTDGARDANVNSLNEATNYPFKVKFNEFNQGDNCLLDLGLSDTNEKNPLFLLYQTTDSPNGEGRLYELYLNSKASVLDFKFYRLILEINGNWEFFIE